MTRQPLSLGLGALALFVWTGALSFALVSHNARADDDTPSEDPSFNFKLPDKVKQNEEKEKEKDEKFEQQEAVNRLTPMAVKFDVEYPKYLAYIALQPAYLSLSQVSTTGGASTQTLGTSQYVPVSFAGGVKAEFTQRVSLEANVAYGSYSTGAQNLAPLVLNASTTGIVTANIDGSYCFFIGPSGLKFCPSVGAGVDGFPIIDYADNTHLQIDSFSDLIVRGYGKLQYPINLSSAIWVAAGYDYGVGKGSANAITSPSDHTIWGSLGFNTPVGLKTDLVLAATYDNKNAGFTQASGGSSAIWAATGSILSITAGIGYHF